MSEIEDEQLEEESIGKPLSYILKRSEFWIVYKDGKQIFKSNCNSNRRILSDKNLRDMKIQNVIKKSYLSNCVSLYKVYC